MRSLLSETAVSAASKRSVTSLCALCNDSMSSSFAANSSEHEVKYASMGIDAQSASLDFSQSGYALL